MKRFWIHASLTLVVMVVIISLTLLMIGFAAVVLWTLHWLMVQHTIWALYALMFGVVGYAAWRVTGDLMDEHDEEMRDAKR